MFNLDGSRAEVASQYPRVFQKATRHVVIATGFASFLSLPKRLRYCWWRGTTIAERMSWFPGSRFDNGTVLQERDPLIKIPE